MPRTDTVLYGKRYTVGSNWSHGILGDQGKVPGFFAWSVILKIGERMRNWPKSDYHGASHAVHDRVRCGYGYA
ncbi:hypothetical protein SERLADRAFT_460955 [Serpula lacrymans var. lacrymans S7.9]|uniref:Uncharacterized protein n=1 Tax=Serpula lacrymans var. lacrymans (strain S7.9) TaxID=578457 RepID=F8NMY2_SERL9|nr:uncharacterized protein SERLADRAFT_460955 [Serpula lacrymans var. lacrymans S7.9]EGO27476.1 hypothetical protein SERLADRAFT_460955 [Serpula lacrymans var. lacrymans S7.9]